jgi:hypothetical protein
VNGVKRVQNTKKLRKMEDLRVSEGVKYFIYPQPFSPKLWCGDKIAFSVLQLARGEQRETHGTANLKRALTFPDTEQPRRCGP